MKNTSPLNAKVISIYNKFFFERTYKHMRLNDIDVYIDSSGTVWYIKDVCKILLTPDKRAK